MIIFSLILSLLLISGFYLIGEKISNILNLNIVTVKISNPKYQFITIGISMFLFILYPIFFLQIFDKKFYIIVSFSIALLGLLNFYCNFLRLLNYCKFKSKQILNNNIYELLILILIVLYFFISISPVTSGDSVSYHIGAAKYILENGHFSKDLLYGEAALVGSGEFLNAFAISIYAYQFTSLINFAGIISIIGIMNEFSKHNFIDRKNKSFLILCILSCPVLVFLTSTSKSQLFSTSLVFFCYALLLYNINNTPKKNFLDKSSYFIFFFSIVAVQTKISFSISFFIIVLVFFLFFFKKIKINKFIFIITLFFLIGLLPPALWKQYVYDYPFYHFFINPFPINIPGFYEVYLDVKGYYSEKFPLILFIPLDVSDLTQFIGLGFFTFIFLIQSKYKNKIIILFIIIFYITIFTLSGQNASRFYLEIYCFIILATSFVINDIYYKKIYKILNFYILLQSVFVISILLYGAFTLLPGSFTKKYNQKVLSNYASGYNLYSWLNEVLPDDAIALTQHRSFSFAKKNIIYIGMSGFFDGVDDDKKKFFIKKIKEKKPNYIVFYGKDEIFSYNTFNFENCIEELFLKKNNVGFKEVRNPLNTNRDYYNGYIYKLNYSKLENCINFH